jgi:hypothetical protein
MGERPELREELACDGCGRHGAYSFTGANLCLDCYEANGSCGAERLGGASSHPSE